MSELVLLEPAVRIVIERFSASGYVYNDAPKIIIGVARRARMWGRA